MKYTHLLKGDVTYVTSPFLLPQVVNTQYKSNFLNLVYLLLIVTHRTFFVKMDVPPETKTLNQ